MRIALNGLFWNQPRTGSGQYLRHLYSSLREVVSALPNGERPALSLLVPREERGGGMPGPLQRLPFSLRPPAQLDKLAWEELGVLSAARSRGANLLHSPYLSAPLARPKGLRVVVTAHDVIPWVVPGYRGSPAFRLYLALAAAGVKRADLVIADSEASRRDAIRVLGLHPAKVHTVYLGATTPPNFSPAQMEEVRARFGLPRDFAFYLGGFDRRKNVPLLLRAWRGVLGALGGEWCALEKPVLAVAGSVPEPGGIFPDVRGAARGMGLSNAAGTPVRFLGAVSEEDKLLLMAAARLFVYPSAYEGFGLDPLHAMSVGCPVVSSSGGSLREVVGDAGLLVPPDDERALCEAVVRAWSDDSLRDALGMKGRERARLFTWRRTAEQTFGLYRRALDRRPS